ncbi:spore photoproduct lyase family protein [Phycisphaera mikurensis]|uniref:spore photoproduct lyase family protein n=1 Tax=Phycisphaera mikurensis TaxID=547188 RepID=UPI001C874E1B
MEAPAAPHLAPTHATPPVPPVPPPQEDPRPAAARARWRPRRVLIARSARDSAVAQRARRAARELGAEVVELGGDAVRGLAGRNERETYRNAKATLAIVNAPPSALKFAPIPPSADFRLDLARGCPAHCQYCYLAGSLSGPPVTRAYANLDEIFAAVPAHVGRGRITSASAARSHEGTTFEASCYTDPLGIEHLTGGLSEAVRFFGTQPDAGLRFTTKFSEVGGLLGLPHNGRTRVRFSVNAEDITRRFDGGTARLADRLAALGAVARAGYPVGLTVAPIMPIEGWEEAYGALFRDAGAALPADADLTVELITHRFTPGSREVLLGWYPGTKLEMDAATRTQKRNKFGGTKYVYPKELMKQMRAWFEEAVERELPGGVVLYWT